MNNEFTDTELANRVKEKNDEGALLELISRHSGIYVDMVKRFGCKSLSIDQVGDILDEKDYNIYKAAIDYEEERAKFSTYLANKTKFICLTKKTQNKKNNKFINYEDVDFFLVSKDNTPDEECFNNEKFSRALNMIVKHKDERVKTIFIERYFGGKGNKVTPWNKVAKKVNLSTQGCINIHNKTIKQFQNKIKNENIKF